jgi:GT2 family glycosyltransferase
MSSGTTAILVLGMHRSGTSLLSSLVGSLGVYLGENFVPADVHNPAGYFEDKECIDIQERLLEALGQPWHGEKGMLPFPSRWWYAPDLQPLLDELRGWIDRRIASGADIWALKDPRTTRFLPMWQELLETRGVTPRYVLAVRDPAAVVASEVARDNVPAQRIYHTWLRYNMEALLHSGPDLAGVFIYSEWFSDGITQIKRLAAALDVVYGDNECAAILKRSVCNELHRQDGSAEMAPDWASEFYARLQTLAEDVTTSDSARLATDMEYCDAMLRQGQNPASKGDIEAIVASAEGLPDAFDLAQKLHAQGKRVVVASTTSFQESLSAGVALLVLDYNGPPLAGAVQRVRDAYALWRWKQQRAYAALHIEGGNGLASSCLDARRQGLQDYNDTIHVHYFRRPAWIREDGVLHLKGMLDAGAFFLEGRVLLDAHCQIHAPSYLGATLRRLVAQPSCRPLDQAPATTGEPMVSICVTHYNRPEMLSDCLNSIRSQRYGAFEVIVVDDGSTHPAAWAFLDSVQDEFKSKGWTLIRQENCYLGSARNTGARAAQGDYLFFLDDDNLLMPNGLERAVQTAQRTGADIVTAVMAMFAGPAGYQPSRADQLELHAGGSALLGLFNNTFGDANALVSRKCWSEVGGFSEDRNVGGEDWEFFAKAVIKGWHLEHSLTPFSWYRVSTTGMARAGNWWKDYRRALRAYEALLPPALRELPALAGMLKRRVDELEPFEPEALELRLQVSKLKAESATLNETVRLEASRSEEAAQTNLALLEEAKAELRQAATEVSAARETTRTTEFELLYAEREIGRLRRELDALRDWATNEHALLHRDIVHAHEVTAKAREIGRRHARARSAAEARLRAAQQRIDAIEHSPGWTLASGIERVPAVGHGIRFAYRLITLQLRQRRAEHAIREAQRRAEAQRNREKAKAIIETGLFDADYYLECYPDAADSGMTPEMHYAVLGWLEGRWPSADFDPDFYMSEYSDVADAGLNPLLHYAEHGRREGRLPMPPSPVLRGMSLPRPAVEGAVPPLRATIRDLVDVQFPTLRPLPIFPDVAAAKSLTIVTDSLGSQSLFGGVGTALVVGTLMAQRLGRQLRIVTRHDAPDAGAYGNILAVNGIDTNVNPEFVYLPLDGTRQLSMGPSDLVLTTSWWTTRSAIQSVSPTRIVYLLQEDERMFYPFGDHRLRCNETLEDERIRVIVNTEALFHHLASGADPLPSLKDRGSWFKPAFSSIGKPNWDRHSLRRNFFFYARPHHARNLFWRGLEAIESSIEEGVLDTSQWNFFFVGSEVPPMLLPGGIEPSVVSHLPWDQYVAFVSTIDLGLSLMDTPHPSYPPIDLAAAGAVVVTSRHPPKHSLDEWSPNILCAMPTVEGLKEGLRKGVALALDPAARKANYEKNNIGHDWNQALEAAFQHIFAGRC